MRQLKRPIKYIEQEHFYCKNLCKLLRNNIYNKCACKIYKNVYIKYVVKVTVAEFEFKQQDR